MTTTRPERVVSQADMLPRVLPTAIETLAADADLCDLVGSEFVTAFVTYEATALT